MKVGIVAQRGNPRAVALAGDIRAALDATVVVDEATAAALGDDAGEGLDDAGEGQDAAGEGQDAAGDWIGPVEGVPVDEMAGCDLVVSIGGDGTFLFAARGAAAAPVMGVNLGEVGFLNATKPEDAVEVVCETVAALEAGSAYVRELPRLVAAGVGWSLPAALNEVAVVGPQRGHGNGVEVEVRIDGSLYTGGHADGVLVAAPTGSTAYNLSEGGPLVHPDVDGIVVTEMCATEAMPSLVVDVDATVTVRVDGAERAYAISDGRQSAELSPPTDVTVTRADTPVRVAGPSRDFFAALGKLD